LLSHLVANPSKYIYTEVGEVICSPLESMRWEAAREEEEEEEKGEGERKPPSE
jgi:hypothetical protein